MNIPKTYLTEAHDVDNKSILRILTQDKQINTSDPKYAYYKKLADWANSNHRQQSLKNVDLNNIKLSDRSLLKDNKLPAKFNTLGHMLLSLKNLMDQKGKYDPESELSKLIQQTTLEILAGLSGIKEADKPSEDPEDPADDEPKDDEPETDKTGSRKGIDWTAEKAKRLADPKGKTTSEVLNQFYDEYYRTEYARVNPSKEQEIINKLKSLDKILIPEFNKLGYNPEVNPFAQFLKNLIKNKYEIFEKLTFNTYGAIHNSFIEKHITGNMLGNYDAKNILFCSDLYNYKGLDIVNYLSLQRQTLDSAIGNSKYSDNPKLLVAKIFIQQRQLSNNYKENIDELVKPDTKGIVLPNADKAKMRSELEISEIYRYLFGVDTKKQVNIDAIVDTAKAQGVVLSMIQYILDQDDFEKAFSDNARKLETWLKEKSYTRNNDGDGIKKSKVILSNYVIKDADIKNKIIKRLATEYEKDQKAGTKT